MMFVGSVLKPDAFSKTSSMETLLVTPFSSTLVTEPGTVKKLALDGPPSGQVSVSGVPAVSSVVPEASRLCSAVR